MNNSARDDRGARSLLEHTTVSLPLPDLDRLVDGGLARGRTRRRRRTVVTGLGALASVAVVGTVVAAGLGGSSGSAAIDPAASPTTTASATPSAAPADPPAPRDLAVRAAQIPDTFASLYPGAVALLDEKENPMDGFDPRMRSDSGPTTFGPDEPGPGIIADFTWKGYWVRVAVVPTDPYYGTTSLERCVGAGEGGNGDCVAQPDGGVLQQSGGVSPKADGGATTRSVTYYTPDRWEVAVMTTNTDDGKDGRHVSPEPGLTFDQLRTVATSDVWFR